MRDRSFDRVVTVLWGRRDFTVYGRYCAAEPTSPDEERVCAEFKINSVWEDNEEITEQMTASELDWLAADALREVEGK